MKRSILTIAALLLVSLPALSGALELRAGEQSVVQVNEVVTDDLYAAGAAVTHLGEAQHDLAAAGGNILIQGGVTGDLFIVGGTITVLGNVGDDVRIAGGTVSLRGNVAGDVIIVGGQVTLSGPIGGDVVVAGGSVRIEGAVEGSVRTWGSSIVIDAPIGGSVESESEKLVLGERALIAGPLSYRAVSPSDIPDDAVLGPVTYEKRTDIRDAAQKGLIAFVSLWLVAKFLMTVGCALIIGLYFEKYSRELGKRVFLQPVPEFVAGLVAMISLPIISLLFILSIIGMPLGIIGLMVSAGILLYGHVIAPIIVGSLMNVWLFKRPMEVTWKTVLMGSVAFYAIGLVPVVGFIARTFFILLSVGAALRMKWDIAKEWR